jgi:hypothetical protein
VVSWSALLDDEAVTGTTAKVANMAPDLAAHLAVAVVEALWRCVDGVVHRAALAAAT